MHYEIIDNLSAEQIKSYTKDDIKKCYFFDDGDKIIECLGCQESGLLRGLAIIRKDLSVYIEWPLERIEEAVDFFRNKKHKYIRFESDDEEIVLVLSKEFFGLAVEPFKIGIFQHDLSEIDPAKVNQKVRVLTNPDYHLAFEWRLAMYKEAWRWNVEDSLTIKAAKTDAKRYVDKRELRVLYDDNIPVCCASVIERDRYVVFENVYVPKEHRGKRYSKALMTHCLAESKHNGFCSAMITTPWPVAINLYQSIGFKRIGDFYSYQNK